MKRSKGIFIIDEYRSDCIGIALLIFAQMCINYFESEIVAFVMMLPLVFSSLRYIMNNRFTIRSIDRNIFLLWLWIIVFNTLVFIYGIISPKIAAYSFKLHFFNFFTIIFLTNIFLKYKKNIEKICVYSFSLAICFISFFVLYKEYTLIGKQLFAQRYRMGIAMGLNPNTIGMTIALLLVPIIIEQHNKDNSVSKIALIMISILSLIMIVITGSKKAILAFLIMLFVPVMIRSREHLKKIIIIILLGIIIIWSMTHVEILYQKVGYRMESMVKVLLSKSYNDDTSTGQRYLLIQTALQRFGEKPILGHGYNSFGYLNRWGLYSHCNFTELLFCFGLFGFSLYYFIPFKSFYKNLLMHFQNVFCITYFCVVLIFEIGAVNYYDNPLLFCIYILVWIITIRKNLEGLYIETY